MTLPFIAGNELSGTITALGEGVTSFTVGDHVIVRVHKDRLGAFAEYSAVDATIVARAPTSVSLRDAAGLPLAGLTAVQVLDKLELKPGDRLLITGGAGGVGLFAIPLAKLRGAHVTTTASPAGEALVNKAGADVVINYKTQKLSDAGERFDKVFDLVGEGDGNGLSEVFAMTNPGGSVITIAGPPTPGALDSVVSGWRRFVINGMLGFKSRATRNQAVATGVHYEFLFMRPDGPQLQQLADMVDSGDLEIVVDSTFGLEDYTKAFERLESRRSKGKVLIEFPELIASDGRDDGTT
jgi:alcohol dehydrogenase